MVDIMIVFLKMVEININCQQVSFADFLNTHEANVATYFWHGPKHEHVHDGVHGEWLDVLGKYIRTVALKTTKLQ